MDVVVYGAGAVGSVLGGLLSLHNHDVLLVCRERHAQAIADDGLRIRSATGDYVSHPRTTTSLSESDITAETVVFLTVKSYDTDECLDTLAAVIPGDIPVVSFQNGIGNEGKIEKKFPNVYGGVCRMTCSMLQPGHASFRRAGRLVVGRHPKGADARAKEIGAALAKPGFEVCVSRAVGMDKWLKLAVNTQSVFHAVIDPRDHDANEFFELKAAILEETRDILKAERIRPKSGDGKDHTIDEMITELRRPRARRVEHGVKIHNSTWQDLYLGRDAIESEYFHGPLIEMAGRGKVPSPYNHTALELANRCHRTKAGPDSVRLSDVLSDVERHKNGT